MILNVVSDSKCYNSYVSCQRLFIHPSSYTSNTLHLWATQENRHRKVALKTSPQHHLTKQQRDLGQSEAHKSSNVIFEQVVGSHWPSEDIHPIAGSHICRPKFIKELQVGIFGHLQVSVIISWWSPHR